MTALIPPASGIIGSSAGGHLASTLFTHFDAGRPDATDPIEREVPARTSAFFAMR